MAILMKEKFEKYWKKMNIMLAVACFLDPRFKCKMVECYYPKIYGLNAEEEIAAVMSAIMSIYEEYALKYSLPPDDTQTVGQPSQAGGSDLHEGRSKKRRFAQFIEENPVVQAPKTDLDQYMTENVHPWNENNGPFDILAWWKCHESKYPILARVARDVLAAPVSTVASESAFSTGGRVVDPHRSSLDPQSVEALICAQDWIRHSKPSARQSLFNDIEELLKKSDAAVAPNGEGTPSNPVIP